MKDIFKTTTILCVYVYFNSVRIDHLSWNLQIVGLTRLDVTHNDLKELPGLSDLRKLALLYAQHNDIKQLPTVEGCEKLVELYFGNNCIEEVPVEFCESLPHLKILDLRDNKLDLLPDEIAMLQHLIRLDLTNNGLTRSVFLDARVKVGLSIKLIGRSLPNTLSYLPHLQNLQVEGNKLKQIRSDVIKGGTFRILKHLREKLDSKALPLSTVCGKQFSETHNFPDWYVDTYKDISLVSNSNSLAFIRNFQKTFVALFENPIFQKMFYNFSQQFSQTHYFVFISLSKTLFWEFL